MRNLLACLVVATLVAGTLAPPAYGQKGVGEPIGVARQSPKPAIETYRGTIVAIETGPCEKTTGHAIVGTHILLKTGKGEDLNVHLGAADAVAETAKQLAAGKEVEVTAFRTDKLPAKHYVAKTLKFDGKTVQLRGDDLRPEWAGGGGRRGPGAGMGRGPGGANGRNAALGQAKYHRLMADLIEAKAAEKPDAGKIERLTEEIQALGQGQSIQPGPGRGFGRRGGRGGGGPWDTPEFAQDREMFHFLLANRESIRRKVKQTGQGVETLTESDDPEVAAMIRRHVESMHRRIKEGRPIHLRDPLFAAVFANSGKIAMKVEPTEKGVRVVETSNDPYVARLIQAHAEVVNLFVANGFAEVPNNHAVPEPGAAPKK